MIDRDLSRAMLIQTLRSHDLLLADTSFQHRPLHTVTFWDLQVQGSHAPTHLMHHRFDVLDHVAMYTNQVAMRGEGHLSLSWC